MLENLDYSGNGGYKTGVETAPEDSYDPGGGGYWGGSATTGYGYCPQTQHYSPSPAILYPSIYSTVNQNQIHLHVHNVNAEYKQDPGGYDDVTTIVAPNNVTISMGGARSPLEEQEYRQDPSVWRPY